MSGSRAYECSIIFQFGDWEGGFLYCPPTKDLYEVLRTCAPARP
jgi:hypothetical protein